MPRKPYPSDLSDEQWQQIEPLLPPPKRVHRRAADRREVVNAILYLLRTGCSWREMPHDFPPWQTVVRYFYKWQKRGVLAQIHDQLAQQLRASLGRDEDPSAAVLDSQSVKTTAKGGQKLAMTLTNV